MMEGYIEKYAQHIKNIIDSIMDSQYISIKETAEVFADTVEQGGSIFVFGCSHAGMITEELFYRTGGFALINPIFNPTLMLNTRPITLTSKVERVEGLGEHILDESPLKKNDTILIHSVSGRNPLTIDLALRAKEKGAFVIGLTSLNYSQNVKSRHSSGKKLYEIADIIIDNCGNFGDASQEIEGLKQKIAPTSTIAGSFIVNSIVIETAAILLSRGTAPPIFHSANVDGGDEFNRNIFEKYKDRIFYM